MCLTLYTTYTEQQNGTGRQARLATEQNASASRNTEQRNGPRLGRPCRLERLCERNCEQRAAE